MAKKKKREPNLRLKMKRLENGLTQERLAEMVGVKKLTISNYERGAREPDKAMNEALAAALKCEVADIY